MKALFYILQIFNVWFNGMQLNSVFFCIQSVEIEHYRLIRLVLRKGRGLLTCHIVVTSCDKRVQQSSTRDRVLKVRSNNKFESTSGFQNALHLNFNLFCILIDFS